MLKKLNEKDQKTVKTGGLAVIALLAVVIFYMGYNFWSTQKDITKKLERDLKTLNLSSTAHKQLLADVPVFQEPLNESDQKTDFRDYLDKFFETKRISIDPLTTVNASNSTRPPAGYGILCLKTSSKGTVSFQRILEMLAGLKENPYMVGIEEFKITCDQDNPQYASFNIVLSTFTNNKKK